MSTNEKDRLDLRQELEKVFSNKRFADIAMEAMPPIDYAQLATKRDLEALRSELLGDHGQLRGEFAGLRGEFAELRGEVRSDIAGLRTEMVTNMRLMFAGQLGATMMLGAWVTAIT